MADKVVLSGNEQKNDDLAQVCVRVQKPETKPIVCDVCGHANPEGTSICEMCSNFLFLK